MRKSLSRQLTWLVTGLAATLLALAAGVPLRAQTDTAFFLRDVGRATEPLDRGWRFHTGDDAAWAATSFDDSAWQSMQVGKSWEEQGHPGYTGFGWYRLQLVLPPDASADWTLALALPSVQDACEVYWNGKLVGNAGKVPPRPYWYWSQIPAVIPLGRPSSGVLAIRVWKSPHVYESSPNQGGLAGIPQAGSLEAVTSLRELSRYHLLQQRLLISFENLFSVAVGLVALFFWLRDRSRRMLMWLALAMVFPLTKVILNDFHDLATFNFFYGMIGPAVVLNDVATWFLLLYLLGVYENRSLVRWARILSLVAVPLVMVDTVMVCLDWTRLFPRAFLPLDVASTIPVLLMPLFGVVIVVVAARKRLDFARWVLAISVLLSDLLQAASDITELGARWTHWTVSPYFSATLIDVAGIPITPATVIDTTFLISILYVAWRYSSEQSERQSSLEQEFRSAQELQQVLIPEELPTLPGYAVTSAYRPAQEVGGDFFQLVALPGDAALLVIGDVSGKGLRAAMAVALIVGAIRSTVEVNDDPAAVLAALNRRLHGRLRGGFATCLVLRLERQGKCLIANAGHLPPFLNGREVDLLPALPLGLMEDLEFESMALQMAGADRLTLYTDGLLEARNAAGELFGFERIAAFLARPRDAAEVADEAQRFGQEDDITVLSLTVVSLA